jgi:SAM-dependent methyltransferase
MLSTHDLRAADANAADAARAAPCPVCASRDTIAVGPPVYRQPTRVAGEPIDLSDLNLTWRRCRGCGYRFIHPPIPNDRLLACYAAARAGHWGTNADIGALRFYPAKRRLIERFSPGTRILDFGCFDGGFLASLGDRYEEFGIEPSAAAAQVAEQRGVNVLGPTAAAAIETAVASGLAPMHAIVAFDVVEHLSDPVATLRDLRRLLAPGGIVLIETGDTDAPGFRRHGVRYTYAGLVEHVALFNRSSITAAADAAGFTLAHFERSWHHVITPAQHVQYRAHNAAYHVLRALRALHVPLPSRLDRVARGPLPWGTRADHFLAVLRR